MDQGISSLLSSIAFIVLPFSFTIQLSLVEQIS